MITKKKLSIHLEDPACTKKQQLRSSLIQHPWMSCNFKIWCRDHKTCTVGAPRWTSTSALANTWLEYYQTSVGSVIEKSEKPVLSSERTGRTSDRQHSDGGYSEVVWIYSKKAGNCIKGKWRNIWKHLVWLNYYEFQGSNSHRIISAEAARAQLSSKDQNL